MFRTVLFLSLCVGLSLAQGFPATPLGLDAFMPVPHDNTLTRDKVALGRKLFFDMRLSRTGTIACGYCHDIDLAFTDGKTVSEGIYGRTGTRNSPALINRGYGGAQFWDGRAASLEEQVLKPLQDSNEMGMTLTEISEMLGLGERTIAQALASYLRTIRSGNSRVDQYLAGKPVLTPEEQMGMRVFRVKGNCVACHVGPNYTDERYHNTGIAWRTGRLADQGRFVLTSREEDRGAFKTPTLREVGRTAPYMHDGSITTLEAVVEHYDRGGVANQQLDSEIHPLHLTADEKHALVSFLKALTGEIREGLE